MNGNRDQLVHAELGDELDLPIEGGQELRRLVRAQDAQRVRFERRHGGDESALAGAIDGRADHPPVAAVDPVEGAERDGAAGGLGGNFIE